jgi:hypothetical protein
LSSQINEKTKLATQISETTVAPQKVINGAILSQRCEDTDDTSANVTQLSA